ncbi:MAG: hypothetical protein R3F30_01595 [Planctomycetota bacterium]
MPVPTRLLHSLALLLALCVTPTVAPSQDAAAAQEPPAPDLTVTAADDAIDEAFGELSHWQLHRTAPADRPMAEEDRGAFPIGDGRVFGVLGLGRRANELGALTGPGYATPGEAPWKGHHGSIALDLVEGDGVVALPQWHIWRLRGANVVVTEDAADAARSLSLSTVSFAIPGRDTLYRVVEVKNRGQAARALTLVASWPGAKAAGEGRLEATHATLGHVAELAASMPARAEDGVLRIALGDIGPGETRTLALNLRMRRDKANFSAPDADVAGTSKALVEHLAWWREKLAKTTTTSLDDKAFQDVLEDWKVLMLIQRSADTGAVVAMLGDRKSHLIGNNGPLLAFLRYGMFAEARQVLDYHVHAAMLRGVLEEELPPDLDLGEALGKEKDFDWSTVRVPNNALPAWVVLQHNWYLRASWDKQVVDARWPMYDRQIKAMQPDPRYTLPTSGDEPWLSPRFTKAAAKDSPDSLLPADSPVRRARSFEASVLYLMALNSMTDLGEERDAFLQGSPNRKEVKSKLKGDWETLHLEFLQRFEETLWLEEEGRYAPFLSPITGQAHRAAFAPTLLLPQWLGFTYALGEHNRNHLRNTIKGLWQNGTRIGTTANVGTTPGDLQGLLVYSLCDLDDQNRNDALQTLVELASPAGGWAEFIDAEGRPVDGEGPPRRLLPSVNGINLDAIHFALNGVRYVVSPGWSKKDQRFKLRLPRGSKWMSQKDIHHDGHHYHIFLDQIFEPDTNIDKSGKPVRKMRFRLRYVRVNKELGYEGTEYVDSAINVGESVYVRYPSEQQEISEAAAWPTDKEQYLRKQGGPGEFDGARLAPPEGADTLVLTSTMVGARPEGSYVVDIGMPMLPAELAALITAKAGDGPRFKRILFDVGARDSSPATRKGPAFWQDEALVAAAGSYAQAGGRVLAPSFARQCRVRGPVAATSIDDLDGDRTEEKPESFDDGAWKAYKSEDPRELSVGQAVGGDAAKGGRALLYAAVVIDSPAAGDYVLRLGSDNGIRVWLNGKQVHKTGEARTAIPDQDQVLVRLEKGANRLLVKLFQDGAPARLFCRVTDLEGLPVEGLTYR